MSDETARVLADARERESAQAELLRKAQQVRLDQIADDVPARVDAYAKKVAHRQPEVTRALGKDGVASLRAELASAAADFADRVRAAVGDVKWREERQVNSAVHSYFYHRIGFVDQICRKHGYKIDQHAGISSYDFFERDTFTDIGRELSRLQAIEAEVASAKAADDKDEVQSLWDD